MTCMNRILVAAIAWAMLIPAGLAWGQKDKEDEGPSSWVYFTVVKDDNGKPVRNAAVILHPVAESGKQERGGLELKTDPEGKANLDGVPLGKLRIQVLAHGFQTYGEDFDIEKPKTEIMIKLKRPQGQFSVYDDRASDASGAPKQASPPAESKKPN
jgi:Carboxypeptidase regulatory-like domain